MFKNTLRLLVVAVTLVLLGLLTIAVAAQTTTPTPTPAGETTQEATAEVTATFTPAPTATPTPTVEVEAKTDTNIIDIAKQTSELSTFVKVLDTAGLSATLSDGGSFTVFAPTNDAFNALPAGTLDKLLADKQALGKLLLYHIVGGGALANDALKVGTLKTLSGDAVRITRTDTALMVNDANAGLKIIQASNGVIYMIDKVLTPPLPAEATSEATSEATAEVTAEATAKP